MTKIQKIILLIVGIIAIALLVISLVFYFRNIHQNQNYEENNDLSDWKIYRNEKYWFEFKYPENKITLRCSTDFVSELLSECSYLILEKKNVGLNGNGYMTIGIRFKGKEYISLQKYAENMYGSFYSNPDVNVDEWEEEKIGEYEVISHNVTYTQRGGVEIDKSQEWFIDNNKFIVSITKTNIESDIVFSNIFSTIKFIKN